VIPVHMQEECGVRRIDALYPSKALKPMSAEKEKMGKWREEEDIMLTRAVHRERITGKLVPCVAEHGCDWVAIAALVPGRTNAKCRQHWVGTGMEYGGKDKTKGMWTAKEDARLTSVVAKLGQNWKAVAELIPGRMHTQCRRRWAQSVDPIRDRIHRRRGGR
jgi:hypothetical protein